jgi:hypothetical protein
MNVNTSSHEFSREFSAVAAHSSQARVSTDLVIEQLDEFAMGMYVFSCTATAADYVVGRGPVASDN